MTVREMEEQIRKLESENEKFKRSIDDAKRRATVFLRDYIVQRVYEIAEMEITRHYEITQAVSDKLVEIKEGIVNIQNQVPGIVEQGLQQDSVWLNSKEPEEWERSRNSGDHFESDVAIQTEYLRQVERDILILLGCLLDKYGYVPRDITSGSLWCHDKRTNEITMPSRASVDWINPGYLDTAIRDYIRSKRKINGNNELLKELAIKLGEQKASDLFKKV